MSDDNSRVRHSVLTLCGCGAQSHRTSPSPPLPLPLSPGYTFCAAPGTQNGIVGRAINVGGLPRNDSESGERPPRNDRWWRADAVQKRSRQV